MAKNNQANKTIAVDLNPETTPILYTDNIIMTTNKNGLVMDVCQRLGNSNRMKVVARVGMSREHAKNFVQELGKTLAITEGQSNSGQKN